jgi:photosystem II stability/assembly factor-like uncharacterized protein
MGGSNDWTILGPSGGGCMFIPTVSPHDPDTALAVCDMTGAYITKNGGRRWGELNLKTRVDSIAFDPVDPSVLYAGSSGLFRSEDGGDKWKLVFPQADLVTGEYTVGDEARHFFLSEDNWPGGEIQAICVDRENTGLIVVGICRDKLMVFVSSDRGKSWMEAFNTEGKIFRKLYIDPTSPPENRRLYVFTDTTLYCAGLKDLTIDRMVLPDRISEIIAADCGTDPDKGKPVFYLTTPVKYEEGNMLSGVMRSLDDCRTWQELHKGLDKDFHGPENGQYRRFTSIAACEGDGRTVYLVVWRYPEIYKEPKPEMNYQGVLISRDIGETWDWVLKFGEQLPENLKGGWVELNYDTDWVGAPVHVGVCPTNPNICYYTGYGMVARTVDGGTNWEQLYCDYHPDGSVSGRNIEVTTCYGVHIDPFDKEHRVISYTDIGMFHSRNGGQSWKQALDGVPRPWINTCYWMVFDPEVKGRAWSVWASAHDLPRLKLFRDDNYERFSGGVCRTENGIASWQVSSSGLPKHCVATHIILDPKSPAGKRTLYITGMGTGVYKSTDDGHTWTLKNNGITGSLYVWRILLLPDGTIYLLVARGLKNGQTADGCIYRSTDGAENWERIALPEGVNAPNDIVYDPVNPKRLYLACWPYQVDGRESFGGLYVTDDRGESWRNIFNPSFHVYGVAVHPDNPSRIFIVTFEGVAFRSDDGGDSWHGIGGYNFKWGHRPIVDPYDKDMLYITTFGSSVWYGPADGVETEDGSISPVY